jgi:hypothetical protein
MEIEKLVDIWFIFGIREFETIFGKTVMILETPSAYFPPSM